MKYKIAFFSLLSFFVGLSFSILAQPVNNLSFEPQQISGGAESSILIEKMKKMGDTSLMYSGIKSIDTPNNSNSPSSASAINTIEGINFDEDAANAGFYHIPPDPIGVIGPNHLVAVNNTSIEVFTKAGATVSSTRLGKNATTAVGSFFASLSPTTGTFDPKVIYDQYSGRFVVLTLERVGTIDNDAGNISRILLAVSKTNDPTAGWWFQAIDSKTTINAIDSWADYPGLAVDEEAIYVTNNMFRFSGGSSLDSRLWIIDKGLYSVDGGSAVTIYAFAGAGLANLPGGTTVTTQPAHMFGTTGTLGTFLVSTGWADGSGNDFLSAIKVTNPLAAPTFVNTFVSLGGDITSGAFPDAPQMGTPILVETNDSRALHAVWRNNNLWATNCILPTSGPDVGQVTAHWYKLSASGAISPALLDQGNIGGEDIATGCYTFFPSIAVNAIGEMMVGFAASASTIYPGAYYTFRFPYDAPGTVQSSKTLKVGLDFYVRTFGGPRNRWGDYSGSSVDPLNDVTFCVFNEYALAKGTNLGDVNDLGRWGTAFGVMPNLDITVLLEGPYAGGGAMTTGAAQNAGIPLTQPFNVAPWNYPGLESIPSLPINIADWVLVTLRKDLNPASPDPTTAVHVASRAAFLTIGGTIVDLNGSANLGFSVEPGNYYIVVQHQNHLAIMSPTAISIN